MKKTTLTFTLLLFLSSFVISQPSAIKFPYKLVPKDPSGTRIYTLENGFKVYLAQIKDQPTIQTYIAVRAGSVYDPKETTGLAHYLEHMLFKGTSKIGTQDWTKESELLKNISNLYEEHKDEKNPLLKERIYHKIDSVSNLAAKYTVANEYDKMISSLGAKGTNAHTWYEETIYKNNIPANELEKWLNIESERFNELVLRLFHTEIEAVYEEFNRAQVSPYRIVNNALMSALFPNHPYGQQTTLGKPEHLKNPSMENIHAYFNKYYVPNNMAMILVGDFEFDPTIELVSKYFRNLKSKPVQHPTLPKESPITQVIEKTVYHPSAEKVTIGFRTGGINSEDKKYVSLIDMILSNTTAGLMDLNLNKSQKVLSSSSYNTFMNDYGWEILTGSPLEGQSLEEVKGLLLEQLEKVKNGNFGDWLIPAIINDFKTMEIKTFEQQRGLSWKLYNSFVHFQDWSEEINAINELSKISKEELVKAANRIFKDNNYVVIYKKKGENKNLIKVENPGITPIDLNRESESVYYTEFKKLKAPRLKPMFIDYKTKIKSSPLKHNLNLQYITNTTNELAELDMIFNLGKMHKKELALAFSYLPYLGTDKYTASEISQEFYKLGISFDVHVGDDKSYIYISGLQENMDKGYKLLEHLIYNAKVDPKAYIDMIAKIKKNRENIKTETRNIVWQGIKSFLVYGDNSPLRNKLSIAELEAINPNDLVSQIHEIERFPHHFFYYGNDSKSISRTINDYHKVTGKPKSIPEKTVFRQIETDKKVIFVDYDMVQAQLIFLSKGVPFTKKNLAVSKVFNSYFGSGLSSIVFQEIRESKSLAYSAWARYRDPNNKDEAHYIYAFVGTQANKLPQAVDAMIDLLNKDLPLISKQFKNAKESVLKQIESERIVKSSIYWRYENLLKLGIDYDNREEIYNEVKNLTMDDMNNFFNQFVKGKSYSIGVIGKADALDLKALEKLGKVSQLKIDYLFGE